MKSNPHLQESILEVVDNQIRDNNPPESKQTYERLLNEGHSEIEAKKLIGCVVAAEIFYTMKNNEVFNIKRFVASLNKLPAIPGEEE